MHICILTKCLVDIYDTCPYLLSHNFSYIQANYLSKCLKKVLVIILFKKSFN